MKRLENRYIVKEYIYYYMKKKRLSRRKFCKKCGISKRAFGQIVKNNLDVFVTDLLKVFSFINVPYKYIFLNLDGEMLKE